MLVILDNDYCNSIEYLCSYLCLSINNKFLILGLLIISSLTNLSN